MDQTVNLTSTTSVVRIHLFPPQKRTGMNLSFFVTNCDVIFLTYVDIASIIWKDERGYYELVYNKRLA